jgi:hypothetical protein
VRQAWCRSLSASASVVGHQTPWKGACDPHECAGVGKRYGHMTLNARRGLGSSQSLGHSGSHSAEPGAPAPAQAGVRRRRSRFLSRGAAVAREARRVAVATPRRGLASSVLVAARWKVRLNWAVCDALQPLRSWRDQRFATVSAVRAGARRRLRPQLRKRELGGHDPAGRDVDPHRS